VLPTPPFWLATVMTLVRPGAGKGSWSAACRTRVARRASIAIGLSKSAGGPSGRLSAARELRSRSPGSVIAGPSVSRGTGTGTAARSTWNHPPPAGRWASPRPPGHDHHGSGSVAQGGADGPRPDVVHAGRLEL